MNEINVKRLFNWAKLVQQGKNEDSDVSEVIKYNDLLYGLTFSGGYNKWNVHLYYGLNDLLTNTLENDYEFGITEFRIGLIFYVF